MNASQYYSKLERIGRNIMERAELALKNEESRDGMDMDIEQLMEEMETLLLDGYDMDGEVSSKCDICENTSLDEVCQDCKNAQEDQNINNNVEKS